MLIHSNLSFGGVYNMTLYVIFNNETNVVMKEVSITKETEKQFTISCEGVSRKILAKASLEQYLNGYIFGHDKDTLVNTWNEYHSDKVKALETETAFNKALITKKSSSDLLK